MPSPMPSPTPLPALTWTDPATGHRPPATGASSSSTGPCVPTNWAWPGRTCRRRSVGFVFRPWIRG